MINLARTPKSCIFLKRFCKGKTKEIRGLKNTPVQIALSPNHYLLEVQISENILPLKGAPKVPDLTRTPKSRILGDFAKGGSLLRLNHSPIRNMWKLSRRLAQRAWFRVKMLCCPMLHYLLLCCGMCCCVLLCCAMLSFVPPSCPILCYVVLRCAMLCYVVLCCAVFRYVVLSCVMLCYILLCCAMFCYAVLCCAMFCYVVLCSAMLCHVVLCCAVLGILC